MNICGKINENNDLWNKEKNKLSGKVTQLQMCMNDLKVSKCFLEENLLPGICRAQVAKSQNQTIIIQLPDLQHIFMSQPKKLSSELEMTFSEGYVALTRLIFDLYNQFKTKQAPRGEVKCVIHEEVCYIHRDLSEFYNLLKQKFWGYMWE